ncbi:MULTISPECIES: hypothetical protein [Burkholderia]|uniref:hypothetical protein n=1 Tax=Burkholderia TaxID=32008 RepID=UPI000A5FBA6B|nr:MULTISPECIES: hypothetical protein [Burkholderia]
MIERGTLVMFAGDIFSPMEALLPGDPAHAHRRRRFNRSRSENTVGRHRFDDGSTRPTCKTATHRFRAMREPARRRPRPPGIDYSTTPTSDHRLALGCTGEPRLMR